MTSLDTYIDDLVNEKWGHQQLEPAVFEEMRRDIMQRIDDLIMKRSIEALSDADVDTLERTMQAGASKSQIQEFITTRVPDFTSVATNVLIEFRGSYMRG